MPRIGNTTSNAAPDVIGPRLIMLLCVLGLTLLGFVMIYSASSISAMSEDISTASYLIDQLGFAVVGVIAMFVLWKVVPYRFWEGPAIWVIWGVAVALLLLTAIMGLSALGAQRWLRLGPISLQPSEFVKIAIVLMAAKLFSEFRMGLTDPRTFIVQMIIFIVAPTGFLFATQSDLGTTAIIALGVLGVMWLGEVPLRTILIVIGCLVVFALGATVFSSYRGDRFLYLNPWNDGENGYGRGYQIIHSYYAFAEGGIFGTGLGNSREKYLYLPESETDFIYAIIGEELGLIGAVAVIIVWLILLWAGMRIARAATDDFGACDDLGCAHDHARVPSIFEYRLRHRRFPYDGQAAAVHLVRRFVAHRVIHDDRIDIVRVRRHGWAQCLRGAT